MRTTIIFLVLFIVAARTLVAAKTIKIGAIFHSGSEDDEKLFHRAINDIRLSLAHGQYVLKPIVKHVVIDTDTIGTAKAACELLQSGVAAIFGPKSPYTKHIVSSIATRHDVPHMEYSWRPIDESTHYSTTTNLYPSSKVIAKAIADITKAMTLPQFTAIYETDDGLARLQEALKLHGPNDNPITVRQLGEGSDHRSLFKQITESRETNIILDVSSENLIDILKQASEVNLMKDYHTWLISDLDFAGHKLGNALINSTVNITGFGILTNKTKAIENRGGEISKIKLEPALLYDAVMLFNKALTSVNLANALSDSPLELAPTSIGCDSDDKYSAGQNLTDAIRSETRVNKLTGPMAFDEFGQRHVFELQIMEFHTDEFIPIGIYDHNGLTITRSDQDREEDMAKKMRNHRWRVTTRLGPPFFIKITDGSTTRGVKVGDHRYEGYSVDLIDEIAKLKNFSYEFELVPDGKYGSYNDVNKSWDGLVKRLRDRQAELAICDLTINHQRGQAVDFTMPFMNLGISILYSKPPVQPTNLFSFLSPFSTEVWIYVAGAYIGVSVMLFLLARVAPGEWDNPHPCNPDPEELENSFNLMNSMWLTIGSLMQQGSDILPKAPSIRMVAGMWWFFVLIMVSSYTANLAAFLTTGKMGDTISSAEDLAAQTKIKYGAVEGGSTSMFFKDSNNSVYQRMWAAMHEARPSVFTKNNDDGLNRVLTGKRGYAFIMESTFIEYYVERHCQLEKIGGLLDNKGYGIAMPPNSAYRTSISKAVLELQEKGRLEELKKKWWKADNSTAKEICDKEETKEDTNELELRLDNVGGMFLVLGCGCAASLLVGILEFLWNVRKVAVEEKITPKEALIAELKFAVNIWEETKPVRVASRSRDSSTGRDRGGIGRAASVARSMVGSFLRLDMIDKFEKDNTSNNRSGKCGGD